MRRGSQLHGSACSCFLLLLAAAAAQAQQAPTTRTDPTEAAALNAVFAKLGVKAAASWNISGDPCTGAATDNTDIDNSPYVNPAIKCVCTFNNSTVCRITTLKIYAVDAVGPIPQELQNLTLLTHLNLGQNNLTGPLPSFIGELTSMQYMNLGFNALSGPVPKELGNLVNLVSLSIGSNNFSGSLPSELGSLSKLERLHVYAKFCILTVLA